MGIIQQLLWQKKKKSKYEYYSFTWSCCPRWTCQEIPRLIIHSVYLHDLNSPPLVAILPSPIQPHFSPTSLRLNLIFSHLQLSYRKSYTICDTCEQKHKLKINVTVEKSWKLCRWIKTLGKTQYDKGKTSTDKLDETNTTLKHSDSTVRLQIHRSQSNMSV